MCASFVAFGNVAYARDIGPGTRSSKLPSLSVPTETALCAVDKLSKTIARYFLARQHNLFDVISAKYELALPKRRHIFGGQRHE